MKRHMKYVKPESADLLMQADSLMEAASQGGVTTGDTLGNDYSEGDISYSRRPRIWDDDELGEEY